MTKYKNIASVAHNLGHSFLSDMNTVTRGGRYVIVPRLLFDTAARERIPEVTIDLIARSIEPATARTNELEEAVGYYAEWLPKLLASHSVTPAAVTAASLTLQFDHERVRRTLYERSRRYPNLPASSS